MIYIGIDPGLSGAVAAIERDGIMFYDTPTITMKKAGGTKTDYVPAQMAKLLKDYDPLNCHVFIEQVGAMPGQGVTSMFGFGKGYGLWIGIVATIGIPYTFVTPQAWKKSFMLGKADKNDGRLRAIELFPDCSHMLTPTRGVTTKPQSIGRADALLIAEHGRRMMERKA